MIKMVKARIKTSQKPWTRMNAAELAQATKGFESIRFEDTRPLNAAERRQWNQSRRGRPRKAVKAARVLITLDPALLARADSFAQGEGLSRSQLIAKGLTRLMPR